MGQGQSEALLPGLRGLLKERYQSLWTRVLGHGIQAYRAGEDHDQSLSARFRPCSEEGKGGKRSSGQEQSQKFFGQGFFCQVRKRESSTPGTVPQTSKTIPEQEELPDPPLSRENQKQVAQARTEFLPSIILLPSPDPFPLPPLSQPFSSLI